MKNKHLPPLDLTKARSLAGRILGLARTFKKSKTSAANGRKSKHGGRPRKKVAA